MSDKKDFVDDCLNLSCQASCTAVRIYNIIRMVGREELTADNALHQLVEDYHNMKVLSDKLRELAYELKKEAKQ